jgi:hypothetical protein
VARERVHVSVLESPVSRTAAVAFVDGLRRCSTTLRYTKSVAGSITLWRPVGQRELDLIAESGWTRFPPRLAGQPIFYPVLNEGYATRIARDWNTKDPASGHVGHVLRFAVDASYAASFPPQRVGGAGIDELWVPAEQLEEFNNHIVGTIELVATYPTAPPP